MGSWDKVTMWYNPKTYSKAAGKLFGEEEFGGRKPSLEKTSTLNPEQQAVIERLSPFVSGRIGQGLPAYGGPFTAPLSELEKAGLDRAREFVDSGPGAITTQGLGAYSEGLEGLDIDQVTDFFNTYFRPTQEREFRETVLPTIRESFVAPGTFRSTGRQEAEARSAERFGESNLAQIGQMVMAEREGSRSLLSLLPSFAALEEEAPLRRAEAGVAFGNIPRAIEQAEIASRFGEFQRTQPEMNPIIEQALALLGTPTQAAFFDPGRPNQMMELLKAVSAGIGAAAGSAAKAGGGA